MHLQRKVGWERRLEGERGEGIARVRAPEHVPVIAVEGGAGEDTAGLEDALAICVAMLEPGYVA
jgi:hypothetical protein